MPKFFVTSDIHSAYTPLKKALDEKGFDPNNENHWLVVCGDVFDRMDESNEVLKFLMSLKRKVLVRGNHDYLLEECCMREYPAWHDVSNGTKKTIEDIGGASEGRSFDECCNITWNRTAAYRNLLQNYFETQNYIFVHSWIPTISQNGGYHQYDKNWRNATNSRWDKAMWGNPFELADVWLNQTGKTIVFGHFHTSYAYSKYEGFSEFGEDAKFDIYYGKDYIGLDACTAYTGKVNVLVIEDEFLDIDNNTEKGSKLGD